MIDILFYNVAMPFLIGFVIGYAGTVIYKELIKNDH